LIILLHGVPGVGKTSTAETIADATGRPLLSVTCGDIGESASEVEKNLELIFTNSHRWGCVLLLDEAEVFLAKRNHEDLKRNAMVSVFLRVLEYYSGILFLTTNRVGTIDEAFKSRIHISLYCMLLENSDTPSSLLINFLQIHLSIGAHPKESGKSILTAQKTASLPMTPPSSALQRNIITAVTTTPVGTGDRFTTLSKLPLPSRKSKRRMSDLKKKNNQTTHRNQNSSPITSAKSPTRHANLISISWKRRASQWPL
jgi:hypothetical protein